MRVARSEQSAEEIMKNLISSMRKCKKLIDGENKIFDKEGIAGLSKGQPKVLEAMREFQAHFQDAQNTRELSKLVPENLLKLANSEYDGLQKSMAQYEIHLRVASNVSQMFLDSMKASISHDVKKDRGYNKDGLFLSDKRILASMPSITFNDKV